jgi:hypothetical protein
MAYTVTPSHRRWAMIALLTLALAGFVIRHFAANPSTLRDIGTLLLVLWLPLVGNLVAFFVRRIPRRAPPATEFAVDAPFSEDVRVSVEPVPLPDGLLQALDPPTRRCTLLAARSGFTARLAQPLVQALAGTGERALALQLLHPAVALARLPAGTEVHLLVGRTGVARGRVL